MKTTTLLLTTVRAGTKRMLMGLVPAVAVMLLPHDSMASLSPVDLGTASGFAVLAGSGITVAGAVNTTTITGDIGTFPTPAITGLGNVVLNGVNHANDAVTQNAKNDLVTAYNDAAGRTPVTTVVGDILGSLFLTTGVYGGGALDLTGTLTLDAQGDPNAVWIFQAASTLITASSSKVNLINGGQACHVFWQVGSSATLGTYTDFIGNILALTSITLNTGATVNGRLLALNGAVTLDSNTITKSVCNQSAVVPEPTTVIAGALLLLPFGVTTLRKLRKSRVDAA